MVLMTFSNILGAIILIAIILPWFLIAVLAVSLAYLWAALFYQESARELKRLGTFYSVRQTLEMPTIFIICRCSPAFGAVCTLFGVTCRIGKVASSFYRGFLSFFFSQATIRAYGESDRFRRENVQRIDTENRQATLRTCLLSFNSAICIRAYMLTVVNQRWLGIRLDILGVLLTFIVAILTVSARFSISPAQTGVTLTYIISVQQVQPHLTL
jgi:hypothetical protein